MSDNFTENLSGWWGQPLEREYFPQQELSLAERDRRWQEVRAEMANRGLDALIVWGDTGKWDSKMANVRYLTQVGGNGEVATCVFPLKGEPVVILWSMMMLPEWTSGTSWVHQYRSSRMPRYARPSWSKSIVKEIQELGLHKGRLGVVGLEGTEAEGDIPYVTYSKIQELLPEASFENATDLMETQRNVKSAEEIEFLRRAALIGDYAAEAMYECARPGVTEAEVVASMHDTLVRYGSEIPIMFLWGAGKPNRATRLTFARGRKLEKGDVIDTEYSPRYSGYYSHAQRPLIVGKAPDPYDRLFDASLQSYGAGVEAINPGLPVAELCRIMFEPIQKAGFDLYAGVFFHGMCLGWEKPYGIPDYPGKEVLKEGMVLGMEPGAATPDLKMGVHVGDQIVVTATGYERLNGLKVEVPVKKC